MIRYFLVFTLTLVISNHVYASSPTCAVAGGTPYCPYVGKVKRIYVNNRNMILMYFDHALDVSKAHTVGLSPSTGVGAIIRIDDKPQFAKLFYSTALAAQASGREVSVQMRGVSAGY